MTQHPDYHVVSSTPNILGEGPIWDPRSEAFLWVDAYRRGFFSVPVGDGGIGTPQFHPTGLFTIGITALGREAGRYLIAGADGLYEYTTRDASPDGAKRVADAPFARISQEYGTPRRSVPSRGTAPVPNALPPATAGTHRFNDVIAAPDGSYLAGMMPWNPGAGAYNDGGGALVRYTRRDRVALVLPNPATPDLPKPRLPNGMGFSPDGRWFYWTDTLRKTIYRFPYDAGTIGAPEAFIVSTDQPGAPDGMTVALDGSILSARWGGRCVDHYNPDGTLRTRYAVPMRQPSSVAFGGSDLGLLFVTSATEGMAPGEALPEDGITITLDIGQTGRAEFSVSDHFLETDRF